MQFLRQAIDNLLSNAVKYSPQEILAIEATIRRTSDEKNPAPKFVSATGRRASRRKIWQVQTALGKSRRATNIPPVSGLSICKRLVELMSGTLRCESELGKGHLLSDYPAEADHA